MIIVLVPGIATEAVDNQQPRGPISRSKGRRTTTIGPDRSPDRAAAQPLCSEQGCCDGVAIGNGLPPDAGEL